MYHSSHCHSCLSHWLSHHIVLGHIRRENAEQAATMTPENRPQTSCFSDHRVFVVEQQQQQSMGSRENQTTECSVVEQQQQSRGVDLLSSRRNAHCCIWCNFYPTTAFCRGGLSVRGALRGVSFTCLIMFCESTWLASAFVSSNVLCSHKREVTVLTPKIAVP